jgi:hypothetical protein
MPNGYPQYSARTVVTVTGSPFVLTNASSVPMRYFISIGTVILIEFSRDQTTWDSCGVLGGQFSPNPADSLRITYVIVPPTIIAYAF